MAQIGYARVISTAQNIGPQIEALLAAGCEKIYQEKISGADASRPELVTMLDYVREDDIVVCSKICRMARSTKHLLDIVETLESKRVALRILNINLDTSTPTGKLMLSMLAAISQFEREIMLERQRTGIEAAKVAGKYKGRKATAMAKSTEVQSLLAQGITKQTVADQLEIGIASVYRIAAL